MTFRITNRLKAFKVAFSGITFATKHELHFKIHLFAATVALACAAWFNLNQYEWISILLCIAAVLTLELINSAIERICNLIEPNFSTDIKIIKDMSAGAVLIASIISVIVGLMIFLPKF